MPPKCAVYFCVSVQTHVFARFAASLSQISQGMHPCLFGQRGRQGNMFSIRDKVNSMCGAHGLLFRVTWLFYFVPMCIVRKHVQKHVGRNMQ